MDVSADASLKRPFVDASVRFMAGDAPVEVLSENPVKLADGSGLQDASFTLQAERGGTFTAELLFDAGPAGSFTREILLETQQVEFHLDLEAEAMESPQENTANLEIGPGPFDQIAGDVEFKLEPSGRVLGAQTFSVGSGETVDLDVSFDALDLEAGTHRVVATADFTVTEGGEDQEGELVVKKSFSVHRPQLEVERLHPSSAQVGETVQVISIYRNTGNVDAVDVIVHKQIPQGFSYWVRDGPLPLPQDPLGSPEPDSIELNLDGTMNVTWSLGTVPADGQKSIRYGLLPYVPGEGTLVSDWSYGGDFSEGSALFTGQKESVLIAE